MSPPCRPNRNFCNFCCRSFAEWVLLAEISSTYWLVVTLSRARQRPSRLVSHWTPRTTRRVLTHSDSKDEGLCNVVLWFARWCSLWWAKTKCEFWRTFVTFWSLNWVAMQIMHNFVFACCQSVCPSMTKNEQTLFKARWSDEDYTEAQTNAQQYSTKPSWQKNMFDSQPGSDCTCMRTIQYVCWFFVVVGTLSGSLEKILWLALEATKTQKKSTTKKGWFSKLIGLRWSPCERS